MISAARRWPEVLASDPWIRRTSCSEICPGFELHIHGIGLVELVLIELQVEHQILAIGLVVAVELLALVRPRDEAHAAVRGGHRVDRDPGRARGKRSHQPIFAILMPGHFAALHGRLAQDRA